MPISAKNYRYGSHLPLLLAAVLQTKGPILELGAGEYSTPVLELFAGDRTIVTVEHDPAYREKCRSAFDSLAEAMEACRALHPDRKPLFSVALIDGRTEERQPAIEVLARQAEFLVIHDTEDSVYGYNLSGFHYIRHFTRIRPHTTVVSNYREFKF